AADAPGLVLHQGGCAPIMFRQLRIPFLFGVLHRHLGPAEEHIFEMPERDRHSRRDRWQIQSLGPSEFRSWNGDSHLVAPSSSFSSSSSLFLFLLLFFLLSLYTHTVLRRIFSYP